MKESFILYNSYYEAIRQLSRNDKALLWDVIFSYQLTGNVPEISSVPVSVLWSMLKQQFDRDNDKYQSVLERNRQNGKNGGRPKKNPENPVGFLGNEKKPKKPQKADNDSVSVSDNDSESVKR